MPTTVPPAPPIFCSLSTPVDTTRPRAVAEFVQAKFAGMFSQEKPQWLARIFKEVTMLFEGKHPDYSAIDLHYHNFEHTLQATVCLVLILEGRHRGEVKPRLTAREFELAVAAVLLHDSGYLRLRSDTSGTGAKYTFIHELRSCAFAASYLPVLGATAQEIDGVVSAISCTGPRSMIRKIKFHTPLARTIGCIVATADFLAQMAAPDYVARLADLFNEFEESHDFLHTPPSGRLFKSAEQLLRNTPSFWTETVLPKLNDDFQGVYRYLGAPYADGPNAYLAAIEDNLAKISHRVAVA